MSQQPSETQLLKVGSLCGVHHVANLCCMAALQWAPFTIRFIVDTNLQEAIAQLSSSNSTDQERHDALVGMQMLVEPIDNANGR